MKFKRLIINLTGVWFFLSLGLLLYIQGDVFAQSSIILKKGEGTEKEIITEDVILDQSVEEDSIATVKVLSAEDNKAIEKLIIKREIDKIDQDKTEELGEIKEDSEKKINEKKIGEKQEELLLATPGEEKAVSQDKSKELEILDPSKGLSVRVIDLVEGIILHQVVGDTNGDSHKETLIITQEEDRSIVFYIFDANGQKIYQHTKSYLVPEYITLKSYQGDSYNSYHFIFEGEYRNEFYLRWDGQEYGVPEDEKGAWLSEV